MSKSIYIIMGVSGTGKTTIGKLLAKELEIPFFDGDDYHPKKNISKMAAGNALNDDDRYNWLEVLNNLAKKNVPTGAIIACSALKAKYRTQLSTNIQRIRFIYLNGTYAEVKSRIDNRKGHFMSSALLKSQFNTLEVPNNAIVASIAQTPEQIIKEIFSQLQ